MLAALLLPACAPHAPPADPAFAQLQFQDDAIARLAGALRAAAAADAAGWTHEPLGPSSRGLVESWCTGFPEGAGCWGESEARGHGGGRSASTSTRTAPRAGSSGPRATCRRMGAGGVSVHVELGTVGEDYTVEFLRYSEASLTDRIVLGHSLSLPIEQTRVEVEPSPTPVRAELRALLASPDAFTGWATGGLARLRAAANTALDAGRVERCSYGEYLGDGQPECRRVPPLSAEQAAARRFVDAELARHAEQLTSSAPELRNHMAALLPGMR